MVNCHALSHHRVAPDAADDSARRCHNLAAERRGNVDTGVSTVVVHRQRVYRNVNLKILGRHSGGRRHEIADVNRYRKLLVAGLRSGESVLDHRVDRLVVSVDVNVNVRAVVGDCRVGRNRGVGCD